MKYRKKQKGPRDLDAGEQARNAKIPGTAANRYEGGQQKQPQPTPQKLTLTSRDIDMIHEMLTIDEMVVQPMLKLLGEPNLNLRRAYLAQLRVKLDQIKKAAAISLMVACPLSITVREIPPVSGAGYSWVRATYNHAADVPSSRPQPPPHWSGEGSPQPYGDGFTAYFGGPNGNYTIRATHPTCGVWGEATIRHIPEEPKGVKKSGR